MEAKTYGLRNRHSHESPCFYKIETLSPRNHVHAFELRDVVQLQGELGDFIGKAYLVGCQEHLRR